MSDHLTDSPTGGIQRRTIVAGASWSIPVVATAIGAPLAAASNTGATLAFTNGPYSVAACGTLKDVVIRATTNGTTPVTEGTPITVALPSGLTWSNGDSGSRIVPADTNGEAVLSGLKAVVSGSRTITASTVDASASASVSISSAATASAWTTNGNRATWPAIPAGSTAVGFNTFLTPSGDLYNASTLVASGVSSAKAEANPNGTLQVSYVSNGVASAWTTNGNRATWPQIPAGSTAVGFNSFLTPNGELYNASTLVASGVGSATAETNPNGTLQLTYSAQTC